jgi:hypothetical protein
VDAVLDDIPRGTIPAQRLGVRADLKDRDVREAGLL